jgi:hypothetical protein
MRPKTPEKEALTQHIRIRLTKNEKEDLLSQCKVEKYPSLSELVRTRLLRKRQKKLIQVSEEFVFVFRTLDYDLTKIGTNLNQIAHKLNSYNSYVLSIEDKEVFKGCFRLLRECRKHLEKHMIVMDL